MSEEIKKSKKCGCKCEVWSRVSGYFRPVNKWNAGKKSEFRDRLEYKIQAKTLDLIKKIENGENIDLDSVELSVVQEAEKARKLRCILNDLDKKTKEAESKINDEPLIYSI